MNYSPLYPSPIFIFILAAIFYFLPAIVGRNHKNGRAIFALNLLLGWTLIGWVWAFVWALTSDGSSSNAPAKSDLPGDLEESDLKKCPYCAEKIKREAVKCRFCNSVL